MLWFFQSVKFCFIFEFKQNLNEFFLYKVSKGVLYILSYRSYHPSVSILNEDNKYDVISAIVALTCGLISMIIWMNLKIMKSFCLASNAKEGRINTKAVVIDPVGAIVISLFILIAWAVNAYST